MRKSACKKSNVQKVSDWIDDPNPPSEKDMAEQLNISRRSVGRILNEQLTAKRLKKRTVQHLREKQAKQRYQRGKRFVKYLSRRKIKKLFTMDETMVPTDGLLQPLQKSCRTRKLEEKPRKNWQKKVMAAMGICWTGTFHENEC